MKSNKGNMLLTFIMMTALSAIILSFLYIVTSRVKDASYEQNRAKALYIAEAGINKAVWDLAAPGGYGINWRTNRTTESFAGGQYSVSVLDAPGSEILITSTGEVSSVQRTLQQTMTTIALPPAFKNAVYSNGMTQIVQNSNLPTPTVNGPFFSNGNVLVDQSVNCPGGAIAISAGHTVTSQYGNVIPSTVVNTAPAAPAFDPSFYNGNISSANAVPARDINLSNYDLNGGTLYVNGNATITGNINGGGKIVVTGYTMIYGNVTIGANTTLISNNEVAIQGDLNVQNNGILYSNASIVDAMGLDDSTTPTTIRGAVIAPVIVFATGADIYGLLFSGNFNGNLAPWGGTYLCDYTQNPVNVHGAVVSSWPDKGCGPSSFFANVNIQYDPSYLLSVPPGLSSAGLSLVKGSWKEL